MRIERRADGATVIKHFPVFISAIILMLAFVVFKTLVAPLLETPPRYDTLHVGIIVLLFTSAFAHFMWERVRFEFDPRRRVVIWKRHKLFTGIGSGQIAFDSVTDVVIETMQDIESNNRLTRVALVTKERRLPLTKVYGGVNHNEVVRMIREVVGLDNSAKAV